MICTINSKKVLRCLFSDSGKVLLELPFTKGLFPLKKSMFVVTSQGEQIKHISLLAKQAGSPLHAAELSFCNVSIGFPLLNNSTG